MHALRAVRYRVNWWWALRVDAIMFTVAGFCTSATVLVEVDVNFATAASILGGMFTLAGLCILSFGIHDEGPLTKVSTARGLLVVAAAAGVVQTMVLISRENPMSATILAPVIGLVGGAAVGGAVVALLRARRQHCIHATTIVGLIVIAIAALASNGAATLGSLPLLAPPVREGPATSLIHVAVIASGVGELIIASGFWWRPLRSKS